MNQIITKWDDAEKDFTTKLQQKNDENSNDFSDVLSSSFLYFRYQQKKWLKSFCDKSLEYLIGKGFVEKDDYFPEVSIFFSRLSPDTKQGKSRPDFGAQFCGLFEEENEYQTNRFKKENDRIINGILRGDQKVFNELYEYEFPIVVRNVLRNSGNLDQAKDVFQDSIVILIEKVRSKEFELTCSVKTYLYSISQILWLEQLRKIKKHTQLKEYLARVDSEISIDYIEPIPNMYNEVNEAIDLLSNKGKTLLECFYYKKMSCEEIAKSMGYSSAASVRNQKYKYLEKIRKSCVLSEER